jgi:hypothetical protein
VSAIGHRPQIGSRIFYAALNPSEFSGASNNFPRSINRACLWGTLLDKLDDILISISDLPPKNWSRF